MAALFDAYLLSRAPNTRRAYRTTAADFSGVIRKPVDTATVRDCARYVEHLNKKVLKDGTKLAAGTIKLRIRALKSMFGFLTESGVCSASPMLAFAEPRSKAQKRGRDMIDADKVRDFLNAPDVRTREGLRDRALLAVLLGGGLRRSELLKLRCENVRLTAAGNPYLELFGTKNGDDAAQAIPAWAFERLSAWIAEIGQGGGNNQTPVCARIFADGTLGQTIAERTLARLFKFYASKTGLKGNISPHSVRISAITRLLEQGEDLPSVAQFSRHKSLQAVLAYDRRRRGPDDCAGLRLKF